MEPFVTIGDQLTVNGADNRIATPTLTAMHGGLALNPGEKLCGL